MNKFPPQKTNSFRKEEYKKALQAFQANRIRETYTDLTTDPQYTLLIEFFFEHIYGPQDFSFRNQSIKSLHKRLSGFLKGEIIEEVGRVIQLQELSDQLDELMVEKSMKLDIPLPYTMESYAQVYRHCNNYPQRVQQIELLIEATRGIHRLSQMPFIGWSLKIVRRAAQLAGLGEIMDFLIAGYQAFHSTKNIEPFLQIVEEREKALNDQLFSR